MAEDRFGADGAGGRGAHPARPHRGVAERRADLPQDEPGGLDPKHPARRAWREEGGTLEAVAEDMLRPKSVHAPHLDAVEGQRAGIRQAEEVREALRDDRYRAFGWLTDEVVRQAGETRTEAFHVPRYGEMVAEAQALSRQEALPAHTQKLAASWLKYHAKCEPICRQIRELPARADALTADCPERPATLDALRDWRKRAESMIAEASAMLAKKGPHAPHLAAMPGERGELVTAKSSLESALVAVKAEELRRDWHTHVAEAKAARVDPFYVVGHTELIDRLQQLRNQSAVTALPASELAQIDSILGEAQRQNRALSHVQEYLAQIEPCRTRLQQLNELAHTQRLELRDVPSYDEWHDAAERLSAAGKAIADDWKTYGPCLEHHPGAWSGVHAGIRELAAALGHDTISLRHRQPEPYLEPITRPLPDSQQAKDADASYRRLRDEWHKHVALAESTQTHPYHLKGHAALIDAMRELRNLPISPQTLRQALDTLLHDYTHLHRDRQHIHAYLDESRARLGEVPALKDTEQKLSALDVGLEDIEGYGEWKDRALRLADAGEAILADPERFSIHLDDRPDDARRIRSSVAHLNTALGRDDASERRERFNPCPKTRRPQNAFHNAAASSASARRNWHPATLDGSPVLPEFSRVRDDLGPRIPSMNPLSRKQPHELVDEPSEDHVEAAESYLRSLRNQDDPVIRAMRAAPVDDEERDALTPRPRDTIYVTPPAPANWH